MNKLKEAIRASGISPFHLAKKLGVTQEYLEKVMDKKEPLTLGFADRISNELKTLRGNIYEESEL